MTMMIVVIHPVAGRQMSVSCPSRAQYCGRVNTFTKFDKIEPIQSEKIPHPPPSQALLSATPNISYKSYWLPCPVTCSQYNHRFVATPSLLVNIGIRLTIVNIIASSPTWATGNSHFSFTMDVRAGSADAKGRLFRGNKLELKLRYHGVGDAF